MTKKKVAIIGSGPSGLTAAIYSARANLETVVFTGKQPGGQLTTTTEIENFPGAWNQETKKGLMGPDLMDLIQKQAEHFGAQIRREEVLALHVLGDEKLPKFQLTTTCGESELFEAVIIASGASAKYLGLPGEERFLGKGYHSCATCDGFFYRNKVVAVVGGGDSAMEESNFLTKFATKVYLIHRRDTFKASKIMQERVLKNQKIEILYNKVVTQLLGEDLLSAVELQDTQSGDKTVLPLDGLFVAIGHTPNTSFVQGKLEMDELGYLIPQGRLPLEKRVSKYDMATQIPGIFVAGDVEDRVYRQAITAAGDGCKAAIDCEKWLESVYTS